MEGPSCPSVPTPIRNHNFWRVTQPELKLKRLGEIQNGLNVRADSSKCQSASQTRTVTSISDDDWGALMLNLCSYSYEATQ